MILLLLQLASIATSQTPITVNKYYIDDGHGNCTVWGGSDTACAGLLVSVGNDAVPGDYTYDLLCNNDIIGGGGNVVRTCCGYGHQTTVHVNPDHSYSLDPDAGLACVDNAGGRGLSQLYLSVTGPTNSAHSEGSVKVGINTVLCPTAPPTEVDVNIPVQIGSIPVLPADPNRTTQNDANTGCGEATPMAKYSIHLMLASLHIEDTPISYNVPRGPSANFQVVYNQREANQPNVFNFCNLGPKWTFNWLSYVTDDPSNPAAGVSVYVRGGGTENYSGWNSVTQSYAPDPQSMAVVVKTSGSSYERRLPDGSKQVFSVVSGKSYPRRIFMTQVVDPAGNTTSVAYDSKLRITKITDTLGQAISLTYGLRGDSLKITKVTDPFNRSATFTYTNGQLTTITDPVGIQSQFGYASGADFINTMTTPYGTTTFAKGESGDSQRWLEATDPVGAKERVEYDAVLVNLPWFEARAPVGVYNAGLHTQNTFYWDKKAMADAAGDFSKAELFHWLSTADGKVSGIKHSEKKALENRVWYTYPGQSDGSRIGSSALPAQIARILDDGTTQLYQYQYNALGNVTSEVDPTGRTFSYNYAGNGIDLLQKAQTRGTNNEVLASYTYNSQHLPLTATDAAGQTTTYTYNSYGQVRTITNAKNETTTFNYDRDQNKDRVSDGYLLSIVGPVAGATTTFTYDAAKRVATSTDSDGYKLSYTYNNIDRPLTITYPDNTTTQFVYTDNITGAMKLDLAKSKDRRGRWTYRFYDGNRHLTKITDPLNRSTVFTWCACGSLDSITDAKNNVTTFVRDVQGRVISKLFPDNNAIAYAYENSTGRLKSTTDARNQVANYQYYSDNNLAQVSYTDTSGRPPNPPTPTVSYVYDSNYNRVATMTDDTGTTTYAYYLITNGVNLGAGRLQSVTGPLPNSTITYSYDQLGRELSEAVNGISSNLVYDSLGRVTSESNPLGNFTNAYVSVSPRIQMTTYPNGQSANYTYLSNTGDKHLQTLQHKTADGLNISKFDYTYDAEGEIMSWNRQFGAANPIRWANNTDSMQDLADQLTAVIETDSVTNVVRTNYNYAYDPAGNRTSDNTGSYRINNLNQITNSGYSYDLNGNLTADIGHTYEWDAANRLVAINYIAIGGRSEFAYDGLGRRVKIIEKNPGMSMTVRPPGAAYTSYNSQSFSLSAGSYNLVIQGLNPNGGDNTAFVDAVTINGVQVPNGSFESPQVGYPGYQYNPTDTYWTFAGNSGISGNGSGFTGGNPDAPDGIQVAFIQQDGYAYQPLNFSTGTYTLGFEAAQRANVSGNVQDLQVSVQTGTPIASTKNFVWIGDRIAEERDENNNVTRRFYRLGEQINGMSYYYTRDHLGSIRELTDINGSVRARYDYDPYGVRTKLSGDVDAEFGYTGHYHHAPSGLNLALYRAYDSSTGRWTNRDPLNDAELTQGPNLYTYVQNKPIKATDPDGTSTHYNDEDYLWASGESVADANKKISAQNQLIDDWIKNYFNAFSGVASRSWKAAQEGEYLVDVVWEDFLKWLRKQFEDETKERCAETLKKRVAQPRSGNPE